jgi:tetrapyrrole methylase family protein/MazG family protein
VNDHGAGEKFKELLDVMAQLRGEQGCPWDKEQTHLSLKPCLLEEAYELLDALDESDPKKLREELGDLLLQVVFHSQIAAEHGNFTAADVITQLTEKLIRRHPYVFAGEPLPKDTASVLKQRLQIKANEKNGAASKSALGNVPKAMPALARAQRVTERASHLGFDWPNIEPVWQKVEEEIQELKVASLSRAKSRIGEELGDLLFSLVNLSRFLELQAEEVLAQAIERFTRRFNHIETKLTGANRSLDQASLQEMDALWDEAKELERNEKVS